MKSRGIVGQKIVSIEQGIEVTRTDGTKCNVVHALILENGVRLVPITIETDHGDYAHKFRVERP